VGSILTLLYTMRAFQRIWWQGPPAGGEVKAKGDQLLAPVLLIGLVLLLGLWAEPLVQIAQDTGLWLTSPMGYIQAVLGG
jgi:formate hydrogenlyase subunit 3/multisubunit Na+/H+ antiporter MnhD subunit